MLNKKGRTVILGLDGVPYGLLKELADQQVMPAIAKLIAEGTFAQMTSSLPEVSSVAWSSIITGANPAEHGIFGFTDFLPNTYQLTFPNYHDLKAVPFWNRNQDKRHIIINVPATYPVKPLNGVLISGFVAIELAKAAFPDSLLPELKRMGYKIDVESEKAHYSMDEFIKDLFYTLEKRIEVYRYFWRQDWQVFMLVVTGTDRLMHFLMEAYYNQDHKYHAQFLDYFKKIDQLIGEIYSSLKGDDSFLVLSDHGFEVLETDVYINNILKEKGYLKMMANSLGKWGDIGPETKAFALDPARIYLNLEGKYPRGQIMTKDKEKVLQELQNLFTKLIYNNKKVIKKIHKKEEIYQGPLLEAAPDLVLVGEKGFNLKAGLSSKQTFVKGVFTGKHTQEDAFLLIKDRKLNHLVADKLTVSDIVPLIKGLNS